jgi:hypothetical protein
LKLDGKGTVKVDTPSGALIKVTNGNEVAPYTIFRSDARVFYTDPAGFVYKLRDYATAASL